MKNIRRTFLHGFTIGELIIGLLISMVVVAALVPAIGLKKIKTPLNKFHHGMAQCYYAPTSFKEDGSLNIDANGNYQGGWELHYFYTDNNPSSKASDIVIEDKDYCTFTIPSADFYEIITIGAGGNGYQGTNDSDIAIAQSTTSTVNCEEGVNCGYIHSDSRYQRDIDNAAIPSGDGISMTNISSYIRQLLKDWSEKDNKLYALYSVSSPLGKGGFGSCAIKRLTEGACRPEVMNCNVYNQNGCNGPFRLINNTVYHNNEKINGSFYFDTDAKQASAETGNDATGEKCWYFLHGKGSASGDGYRTWDAKPLKMYLNASSIINVEIKDGASPEDQYALVSVKDSENKIPEKYLKLVSSLEGRTAKFEGGQYTSFFPTEADNARCYSTALTFQNGGADVNNITPCDNSTGRIIDTNYLMNSGNNSGQAGGKENPSIPACESTVPKNVKGVVLGKKVNGSDLEDFRFLEWTYRGPVYESKFGHGGGMGEEKSVVLENLVVGKKLYMYPSPTSTSGKNSFASIYNDDRAALYSIASSRNGNNQTEAKTENFSILLNEMPIPQVPLNFAKPDNRNHFNYLAKIESLSKMNGSQGLKGCTDNTCPGFGGNGIYLFTRQIPKNFTLTIKNLTNGAEYSNKSLSVGASGGEYTWFLTQKCNDNSIPRYGGASLTMPDARFLYCKEPRSKGNPGAVIIIW